jgi:hypothetical protein
MFKEGEMKKFSVILLTLVLAACAVPAMAGDVSMDGAYMLRGRADSNGSDASYFQHELDLNVDVKSGDVKFHWDIELADKDLFDGTGLSFDRTSTSGDLPKGVWDGFYVQWQATDALAFKAGIYGVSDDNSLMFDSAGNGDGIMGLMYKLDGWKLGGYLSKQVDADEDDQTEMILTASGEVGPAALNFLYGNRVNDATPADDDQTAIYFDAGMAAGPVGVYVAYGQASNDAGPGDGGTILLGAFDLSDLIGFDLGLTVINTNDDYVENGSGFGNDYGYAELVDGDVDADMMLVGVEAGYDVNDKLNLSGLAIVMNDCGDLGDGPTEVDVTVTYKFADNVKYRAGYAARSAGDAGTEADSDKNRLWHRLDFKF